MNVNNVHAKHHILSALKIRNGNMDQELKIIFLKIGRNATDFAKPLFRNKNSAKYKLHLHNTS